MKKTVHQASLPYVRPNTNQYSVFETREYSRSSQESDYIIYEGNDFTLYSIIEKDKFGIFESELSWDVMLESSKKMVKHNPRGIGVVLPVFNRDNILDESHLFDFDNGISLSDNIWTAQVNASRVIWTLTQSLIGMANNLFSGGVEGFKKQGRDNVALFCSGLLQLSEYRRFLGQSPILTTLDSYLADFCSHLHRTLGAEYKDIATADDILGALDGLISSSTSISLKVWGQKGCLPPKAYFNGNGDGQGNFDFVSLKSVNETILGPSAVTYIAPWIVFYACCPLLVVPKSLNVKFPDHNDDLMWGEGDDIARERFKSVWGGEWVTPHVTPVDIFVKRLVMAADNILVSTKPYSINPVYFDYGVETYTDIYQLSRWAQMYFIHGMSRELVLRPSKLVRFLLDGNSYPLSSEKQDTVPLMISEWEKFTSHIFRARTVVHAHGAWKRIKGFDFVYSFHSKMFYTADNDVYDASIVVSHAAGRFAPITTFYEMFCDSLNLKSVCKLDRVKLVYDWKNEEGSSVPLDEWKPIMWWYNDYRAKIENNGGHHISVLGRDDFLDEVYCPMHHIKWNGEKCYKEKDRDSASWRECDGCVIRGGDVTSMSKFLNSQSITLSSMIETMKGFDKE